MISFVCALVGLSKRKFKSPTSSSWPDVSVRSSRRSANSLRNTGTFGDFAFGNAKCIQIVVDCFHDTLESFRPLPTKLMQLKASVHYCHGNRHGQLKIALAACHKIGKISKIQEPQISLSQV